MKHAKIKTSKKTTIPARPKKGDIDIELTRSGDGFTVWITTRYKYGRKTIVDRRWVIDGSTLKKSLVVYLGRPGVAPYEAVYESDTIFGRTIRIQKSETWKP